MKALAETPFTAHPLVEFKETLYVLVEYTDERFACEVGHDAKIPDATPEADAK